MPMLMLWLVIQFYYTELILWLPILRAQFRTDLNLQLFQVLFRVLA